MVSRIVKSLKQAIRHARGDKSAARSMIIRVPDKPVKMPKMRSPEVENRCPFCGEKEIEIIGGKAIDVKCGDQIGPIRATIDDRLWIFCVACIFCGATGPNAPGKDRREAEQEARKLWALRSTGQ